MVQFLPSATTRVAWLLLASLALAPAAAQDREAEARAAREQAIEAARAAREAAREAERASVETREVVEARRAEIARARTELREASRRVAELSEQLAREQVEVALREARFDRAVIGIVMGQSDRGVRLAGVTPDSPAARAGLRGGDTIVAVNGRRLDATSAGTRLEQAHELIGRLEEGDRVTLTLAREDGEHEVELAAEVLPGLVWGRRALDGLELDLIEPLVAPRVAMAFDSITPFAGCDGDDCAFAPLMMALRWRDLRLATVDERLGRYFGTDRGVLVLRADASGGALEPGDVLLEVDGQAVSTPEEVMEQLGDADPGAQVAAVILRDRARRSVQLEAPQLARWPFPPPPAPPVPPAPPARPAEPAPPPAPAPPPPPPREGILERALR